MAANLKYKFQMYSLILKKFNDCCQYNLYMLQISVIINFGYILLYQHFFSHGVFHFSQNHFLYKNVLAAYKVTPPILIS